MTARSPQRTSTNRSGQSQANSRLNLPNALCAIRLVGSPLLIVLALMDQAAVFVWLLILLLLTDWLDGKLAILLTQQTTFGARLDSVADVALYSGLLFGVLWMKGATVRGEMPWIAAAVASYLVTCGVSLCRFGRLPSYHTRAAKACWLLTSIAAVSLFADWALWPLRLAAVAVVLTNLETIAISLVLRSWTADVGSLRSAWAMASNEKGRHAGMPNGERDE